MARSETGHNASADAAVVGGKPATTQDGRPATTQPEWHGLRPATTQAQTPLCFLDADKGSYRDYLAECLRILRPNGLVMADNPFAFGQLLDKNPTDADVPAVRAFNDHMPTVEGLQSVIFPLGDGLWVGVLRPPGPP